MKHLLINQVVETDRVDGGEAIMATYLCNKDVGNIYHFNKDKVTTVGKEVTCKNCLRMMKS